MSYDNVCKVLAEKYPKDFARWLLNIEEDNIRVLKTELSIEPVRADSVVFLKTANRILHIEFQTIPDSKPPLPLRVANYYVRLKTQYKCRVTQVVIFLQETRRGMAFIEQYADENMTHGYRVIRMWEQDPTLFLNNSALLPLAPLTKVRSPQVLLAQVASEIAKIRDREVKQNTAACTEILAGLRFQKNLIRQLLSEDIMKESVIYQDIFQKGEQRGEQRGEQKGKQEEAIKFLTRLLNRRFGEIDSSIIERIQLLSTEELEILGEELFDFSDVSNLVTWLDNNEK